MGKNRLSKIKERISSGKAERREAKELRMIQKENEAVYKLTLKLMKQENLTYEQVMEKYDTDPEFSYWQKFQRAFVWMVGDPKNMRLHRDAFLAGLTDEEMDYHKNRAGGDDAINSAWREAFKKK